jgi:hypothetical protein
VKATACIAVALIAGATPLAASAAGGHHSVDDASILDPGECEFETWVTYASRADRLLHGGGQCRVLGVELAIAAEPGRQGGARSQVWQAQLKWAGELQPGVRAGLSITPQWDTQATPRFEGTTVAALLTLQPADGWQVHGNAGRDYFHDGRQARSGVAADWTTPDGRWLFALERYLENRTGFARAGARWFASTEWTFDMSRAQRLHGPRPSNWTVSVTRSFGKD